MDLHDLDVPIDAGPSVAVVAHRADHATDRGAVTACTDGIVATRCVPAVDIVDKTVAVIVHAVAIDLRAVGPVVANEVDVVVVGASAFKHGHDDAVAVGGGPSRGDVPREVGVDVVVGRVDVVPLGPKLRIVGRGPVFYVVVELGGLHLHARAQHIEHLLPIQCHVVVAKQMNVRQFTEGRFPLKLPSGQESWEGQIMGFDMGVQLHNQLAWHRRASRRIADQTLGLCTNVQQKA